MVAQTLNNEQYDEQIEQDEFLVIITHGLRFALLCFGLFLFILVCFVYIAVVLTMMMIMVAMVVEMKMEVSWKKKNETELG